MQPPFVELIKGCEKFEVISEFRHTHTHKFLRVIKGTTEK